MGKQEDKVRTSSIQPHNDQFDFYFDETFHTRKITYQSKRLNIDPKFAFYVGCYIGSNQWDDIVQQVVTLETQYKEKRKMTDSELKATSLMNSNKLEYGIYSLRPEAIDFYSQLLSILDGKVVIHLFILNKYEFLIKNVLPSASTFEQHGINYRSFVYSFTKFATLHPQYPIFDVLLNHDQDRTKRRSLIRIFSKHLQKIEGLYKKQAEYQALTNLIECLQTVPMRFAPSSKIEWDYSGPIITFDAFVHEHKCSLHSLCIDDEQETISAAQKWYGDKVYGAKSHKVVQLRICDWLAGLISRLTLSLNESYRNVSVAEDLSEDCHLLPKEFFALNSNRQKLIQQISSVFVNNARAWDAASGWYSDSATVLYAYLHYYSQCVQNGEAANPHDFNVQLGIMQHQILNDFWEMN